MRRGRRAVATAALLGTACAFHSLLQPQARITVVDEAGNPMGGVKVVLVRGAYPHHEVMARDEFTTDAAGQVRWEETKEWEGGCACVPHGVPAYYNVVCAEAEGRKRAAVRVDDPSDYELVLEPATPEDKASCVIDHNADDWI